jgi:hypothetical protein
MPKSTKSTALRRRPKPAVMPWRQRTELQREYLQRYDAHEPFGRGLRALYDRYCSDAAWVVRTVPISLSYLSTAPVGAAQPYSAEWAITYREAIRQLAASYGLDRLMPALPDMPTTPSMGEELIHQWCRLRALREVGPYLGASAPTAEMLGADPELFSSAFSASMPYVTNDPRAWQEPGYADTPRLGEPVTITRKIPGGPEYSYRSVQPVAHIDLDTPWDPRIEVRADARKRILGELARQLDAELERIAGEAEAAGYRFPDTAPERAKHLRWLFEHVALGRSYYEIAARDLAGPDLAPTVANQVSRYADLLGIRLKDA